MSSDNQTGEKTGNRRPQDDLSKVSSMDNALKIPVAVDAMGGDRGPSAVVEGVIDALRDDLNLSVVIVGDRAQIEPHIPAAEFGPRLEIVHTDIAVGMDDSPAAVLRSKKGASVRLAFELVTQSKACAVVSPGNTGAMMAAGIAVGGIIPGITRPAIASLIPRPGEAKPCVLLDSGANVDCKASQLVQFALMGSHYARLLLNVERPRIALLSNGSELSKGTDMIRSASAMLKEISTLNYIGYVEGRDIPKDVVDVVVCDGFVGNLVLKAMEGTVELVFDSIRAHVQKSLRGSFGMWLAKPLFKSLFRQKLDPSAYGGAPLLGLQSVAVVCHGASNGRAIKNAIRAAKNFAAAGLVKSIEEAVAALDQQELGEYRDGIWDRMGQRFEKAQKSSKNLSVKE